MVVNAKQRIPVVMTSAVKATVRPDCSTAAGTAIPVLNGD
jgi:hypothetical protein